MYQWLIRIICTVFTLIAFFYTSAGAYDLSVDTFAKFSTWLWLTSFESFGDGWVEYLFKDSLWRHWLGWSAVNSATEWAWAWGIHLWAINASGVMITGTNTVLKNQFSISAGDTFWSRWVRFLFSDVGWNYRLWTTAPWDDDLWNNAWTAYIRSMSSTWVLIPSSIKKINTELWLAWWNYFWQSNITHLFSTSWNHWLWWLSNTSVHLWSVSETGWVISGSARNFNTELAIPNDIGQYSDVKKLFTDSSGNHRLWIGSAYYDGAANDAWAAIIRSVDANGDFIPWSKRIFDTELWVSDNDFFGLDGIEYLFTDSNGDHRIAWWSQNDDTFMVDGWASVVFSVSDTWSFIAWSLRRYGSGFWLENYANFGMVTRYVLTDSLWNHWLSASALENGSSTPMVWLAVLWAVDDSANYIEGSVSVFDDEIWLTSMTMFWAIGWWVNPLFIEDNNVWLAWAWRMDGTAGSDAGAAYVWSVSWIPLCWDGILTGSEVCDDGNTVSWDGCSSICQLESGYSCIGEPSVCSSDSGWDNCEWGEFTWTGESKVCVQLGDIILNPICDLNFGEFNQQPITQTKTGTMNCDISVKDHKGISPWYVTLDFGDMAPEGALAWTPDIVSANLSMLQWSGTALWISGSVANSHVTTIDHVYNISHFDDDTVQNVLQRTITGDQLGIYGTQPSFQLVIPAYTVAATYKGTITATLIEE